MKVCGGCGGSRWTTLGILGDVKHRRCRLCGLEVAIRVRKHPRIMARPKKTTGDRVFEVGRPGDVGDGEQIAELGRLVSR